MHIDREVNFSPSIEKEIAWMKKGLIFFLTVVLFFTAITPVQAAPKVTRVVRVGWFDSGFNKMDASGRRSGYAYEYQQKIAAYTGWKYEYVEGSWSDLFEKLKRGEIDLMADVSYTKDRAQHMLFSSQPMGKEEYYIYVSAGNQEITPDNLQSLNGKRVGITKGGIQKEMFLAWEKEHKVHAKLIEVSETEEMHAKRLQSGNLDAYVDFSAFHKYMENSVPILSVGSSEFYFAVNKNKPNLVKELDAAMNLIYRQNRSYHQYLDEKYIANAGMSRYLSLGEIKWLKRHGKIRIGYRTDYLPFSGRKSGQVVGLLREFMDEASTAMRNAKLLFETREYATTEDAIEALKKGDIDVVFPVYFDEYDAEKSHLLVTEGFGESKLDAVVRSSKEAEFYENSENKVAVCDQELSHGVLVKDNFLNWSTVKYRSMEECFQAVAKGEADCVVVSDYRLDHYKDLMRQYKLNSVRTGVSVKQAFALRKSSMPLYSIMSKLIGSLNDADVYASLAKNSTQYRKVGVDEFVRDNILFVLILAMIYVVLVSALFLRSMLFARNMEKANRQLRAAKEGVEAASNAKTEFLYNVSYDIRNPLNAIIGLTDLALRHQNDPETVNVSLKKIDLASSQLRGFINDIFDMSRLERGPLSIHKQEGTIQQICDTIRNMYEPASEERNISYEVNCDKVEHKRVVCDFDIMNRILVNLVSNAIRYTNVNGSVWVEVEELATEREEGADYRFTVRDDGIGMSKAFLKRIFDPFERERRSTISGVQGTGLGMAIVKRLVDSLHGTITVESEIGKGSTVTVVLPIEYAKVQEITEAEREEKQEEEDITLEGKKVLLVEDVAFNRKITRMLLEEKNMVVDEAVNGQEAVDEFLANPDRYDVILMDIQMPVLDGCEATKVIRNIDEPRAKTIPIIALTACAFEDDRIRALQAGMNDHLVKPFDIEALYNTMKHNIH